MRRISLVDKVLVPKSGRCAGKFGISTLALHESSTPGSSSSWPHHSQVRSFLFKSSERCLRRSASTASTAQFTQAEQDEVFSAHRRATRPAYLPRRAPKRYDAAEGEWLQEGDPHTYSRTATESGEHASNTLRTESKSRFDWRLRATSRIPRISIDRLSHTQMKERYPKRIEPSNSPVQDQEPYHGAIQNYEKHFMELLELEKAESEAVVKERLSTWSVTRLKEEGYCVTDLRGYWLAENQFGRRVASFNLGPGVQLPEHRFEKGTHVLLSRLDPLNDTPFDGAVISSTATDIRVCFPEAVDCLDDGNWRMDLGLTDIIFERMRKAVQRFHHDAERIEMAPQSHDRQMIILGTHLRDVLLRTYDPNTKQPHEHVPLQAPDDVSYLPHEALEHENRTGESAQATMGAFQDDMWIQSWATRHARDEPLVMEGDPVLSGLNSSQLKAMATMIGQRISLVQGPPGTGKTKTIIETVKLLKVHFEVPQPILVCTYTNVAVDNLAEGFVKAGVKPLRVSSGGNIKPTLVEYSLDYKLQMHPLQPKLASLQKEEEELSKKTKTLQDQISELTNTMRRMEKPPPNLYGRLQNMESRYEELKRETGIVRGRIFGLKRPMLQDVIEEADVICTTCVTAACAALNVMDFPVVFLDEASMSTEPASLIPLMKGSRHLALIGDHKQLPPVITSREAQTRGLGISLFERLTEEGVVPSVMLNTQYRMHPDISHFPNTEFYKFSLRDGTVDADGNVPSHLSPPTSQHLPVLEKTGRRPSVIFLDHTAQESSKNRSKININEAHIVASIVEDLLLHNPELRGDDIGIIAPYVAQISLLTRYLNTDAKYQGRFKQVLGDLRAMQVPNIEVKTVDGFEGREKEVIIFSTVRSNAGGYIGFLADRRRLNVGLTRAKRGLFVVGNISTLKAGKMSGGENGVVRVGKGAESWRRYADFLSKSGLVITLSGDTLGQALYGNFKASSGQRTGGSVLKG